MENLLAVSASWKNRADKLMSDRAFVETLSKFGKVEFTGAYHYGLMMHGDVDICVVREKDYSVEEVFSIFRELYFGGKFRSYFIGGDWDDPRKGNEFPKGYYVGLKEKIEGEKWKFDIWFLGTEEFSRRKDNSALLSIDSDKKEAILSFKKYRNERKLQVGGQEIYDKVISGEWKKPEDMVSA